MRAARGGLRQHGNTVNIHLSPLSIPGFVSSLVRFTSLRVPLLSLSHSLSVYPLYSVFLRSYSHQCHYVSPRTYAHRRNWLITHGPGSWWCQKSDTKSSYLQVNFRHCPIRASCLPTSFGSTRKSTLAIGSN